MVASVLAAASLATTRASADERHFEIGPRVEYAVRSDTGEGGVLFYPAMMRVALTPAFAE